MASAAGSMAWLPSTAAAPLRVCADPNNLPFSDRREAGFENRLAEMLGEWLDRELRYTWHPQTRGTTRNTLEAGLCDVVLGVPPELEQARTTVPYYRSTFVFVYRADAGIEIESLNDPALREVTIGMHVVGDDYASTPAAAALARRGIVDNLVGYSVYGDYSKPHPPSRLIEAVATGEVDVAIVWGPLAGYFAPLQPVPLQVKPVSPAFDAFGDTVIPFVFAIAMAVREDDDALRIELNRAIETHRDDIEALLAEYGVPLIDEALARRGQMPSRRTEARSVSTARVEA